MPASLALTGKAFAQMQLAAATLDPGLDPLSVAGSFVLKQTIRQLLGGVTHGTCSMSRARRGCGFRGSSRRSNG